jgi:hypothetical protein
LQGYNTLASGRVGFLLAQTYNLEVRTVSTIAIIGPAAGFGRRVADCIALAERHEGESGQAPVLEPDFAEDLAEIIRNRTPREVAEWDEFLDSEPINAGERRYIQGASA